MEADIITSIADVTRLARRAFDGRARKIGVTRPQWQVLTYLPRNEGINQGGLADLLDVEPITVARMIDRLQEAELVERRPDQSDRRVWRLYLTPAAAKLMDQLLPLANELFAEAFAGLDATERLALQAMLGKIRQNLSLREPQEMVSHG